MARFPRLSDHELDRLLAGKSFPENEELDELAAFALTTKSVFVKAPDELTKAQHLRAIAQEASRATDNPSRAEEPTSGVSPRRRLVLKNPFASLAAKLVFAAVLALTAFSGAAYAGKLPGGVQAPVAGVADNVGLSIPDGSDENNVDQGNQNNTDDGAQSNTDDGAQSNTDDGAQSNTDDGAQNNTDDGAQNNTDDGDQGDAGGSAPSGGSQGSGDQGNGNN